MNGAQDLGGMMGFGRVVAEADEPFFHAEWEKRALALTLACGALGEWNIDISRFTRESIPPPRYLSLSYYEIWIEALTKLLETRGMLADGPAKPTKNQKLPAANVAALLARGGPCDRPAAVPPAFAAGDKVRSRNIHPLGHTRLPRYARGKLGVIEKVQGCFVFPDSNGLGQGENPHWVYSVVFTGRELWGEGAAPGHSVAIDCWEPYLDPL